MHNLEFMKGELSIRQPAEVWRRKPWRTHRQREHRFTKMGHSKDRNTLWYGCSCREVNGIFCPAKIWLGRGNAEEEENEENGELMATNWLVVKLIGAHTHPAQQANIIVQSATLEMIKRAVQEPDKGATKIRNDVLNDLRKEYKDSLF